LKTLILTVATDVIL